VVPLETTWRCGSERRTTDVHISSDPVSHVWRDMIGTDPSVHAVATGLSRVHRWLNRTIVPWTTIQHVYVCDVVATGFRASEAGKTPSPEVRMALLFHDVEDMLGADVPAPMKTQEQRWAEEDVRRWVYSQILRLPYPGEAVWGVVKGVDMMVRTAEAHTLMPPRMRQHFVVPEADVPDMLRVSDVILDVLALPISSAVEKYTELVRLLRQTPQIRAMEGRA